jgi:hypothetical protein
LETIKVPNLNPQQVADRWASNLGAATQKIQQGVQSVTVNPAQLAAAAVGKWVARITDPATQAKFVNSLNKVSTADWQNATITKGLPRIATGAQAAKPKVTAFLTQFLPYVMNVQQQVKSMPSNTAQERIARMVQNATLLSQFKRS